jgi:hypothetical protein
MGGTFLYTSYCLNKKKWFFFSNTYQSGLLQSLFDYNNEAEHTTRPDIALHTETIPIHKTKSSFSKHIFYQ